jgi:probable F420-dependent oxidoreductase
VSKRPFRFAVGASGLTDRAALVDHARSAESIGYSTLLIPDHLLDQLAPLPALAAVATATTRLRLGTFVLNNDLRHPAVLAQELATVDMLSDGRLEVGLGAGWNAPEYEGAGLSFDKHAVRFARLTESLQILKGLFGDGAFSFAGQHYQITEMDGRPKPVQRPHPPFLIGGGGRKGLEFAAREAQIVGLAPRLPSGGSADIRSVLAPATDEKLDWIRSAAGDRFDSLEVNTYPCLGPVQVTDDPRSAAMELAARLAERYSVELTAEELLESPHVFYGTVSQLVAKCLQLRERWSISNILVLGDVRAFAAVVEQLSGR